MTPDYIAPLAPATLFSPFSPSGVGMGEGHRWAIYGAGNLGQCSRASGSDGSARSCVPVWRAWDRAPSLGFPAQAQGLALSSPSPVSLEGAAEQGGVHAPLLLFSEM